VTVYDTPFLYAIRDAMGSAPAAEH